MGHQEWDHQHSSAPASPHEYMNGVGQHDDWVGCYPYQSSRSKVTRVEMKKTVTFGGCFHLLNVCICVRTVKKSFPLILALRGKYFKVFGRLCVLLVARKHW